jgi:hypothetical protein
VEGNNQLQTRTRDDPYETPWSTDERRRRAGNEPAIRAVTREALARGISVAGFSQGYAGVLEGKTIELTARAVGSETGRRIWDPGSEKRRM